jgi:hypothetical protein
LTNITIHLNPECNETIKDFKYVKENNEGAKLKEKTKHASTKVTYEKYGHTSDCLDYLICEYFKDEFINYQRGGDEGIRSVVHRKNKYNY